MGDELILVGNMKLLLKQGKKVYVACSNQDWLINFHKQFFENKIKFWKKTIKLKQNKLGFFDELTGEQIIFYLQELPKGFRSTLKFVKKIKDLKYYLQTDTILIWGGEIFTEETPGSYWYWLASVWPFLYKNLYLTWWIQIPKKFINKIPFKILTLKANKILVRDYEFKNWSIKEKNKVEFFPDTSFFVEDNIDIEKYKWLINIEKQDYIVINLNKKAEKFYSQIKQVIQDNYNKRKIYFARVCKSPADDDIKYFNEFKRQFPNLELLDWENWNSFIKLLGWAKKVFTTRLHLFLVSYYLDCSVEPFEYEKKVKKMKEVLQIR